MNTYIASHVSNMFSPSLSSLGHGLCCSGHLLPHRLQHSNEGVSTTSIMLGLDLFPKITFWKLNVFSYVTGLVHQTKKAVVDIYQLMRVHIICVDASLC